MMGAGNQTDLAAFETAVNLFYDKIKNKGMNYYELLGIPTNATHRDIESAYKKYSGEFSPAKVAAVSDPELKKKAQFLVDKGKRAYDLLIDFDKRAQYEKLGYRDVDPGSLKEEDPIETAREIYRKAKTLFNQRNYSMAIKGLEEAINLDPSRADYMLLLGRCQAQIPSLKHEAEESLRKASEMESWNAEPFAALGMLFYSERLYKRAEGYFRRALELEPTHDLSRKKLEEIVGPQVKPMEKVQKTLGKVFPSFFGKKKK
ncbi:MAG: DnaJ domain-containing protein [Candidatus Aminicenantes bacterium]|nr:MAG: DnaJ domain-containing protein [Candidatus Aminicenantes bacterium]